MKHFTTTLLLMFITLISFSQFTQEKHTFKQFSIKCDSIAYQLTSGTNNDSLIYTETNFNTKFILNYKNTNQIYFTSEKNPKGISIDIIKGPIWVESEGEKGQAALCRDNMGMEFYFTYWYESSEIMYEGTTMEGIKYIILYY